MDDSLPDADSMTLGAATESAFSLLSDETRLSIVRALFEADEPLSFSALRELVGVSDSGQFNYHLGKLTGHFVARTEEGYELAVPGELVVGAVVGGSYENADVRIDPVPVEGECPQCGCGLAADYAEMHMRISCTDCGMHVISYPTPPGILQGRDREALPAVFSRFARSVMDQITGGVCPLCYGPTGPDLASVDGGGHPDLTYSCGRCGSEFSLTVAVTLLDHPAVRAFANEHGLDVTTAPLWELGSFLMADQRRVDSDEVAVEAEITLGEETLLVRLDDDLAVVETSREH